MNCPVCGSKAIGRVGVDQFYCWDCCVEYRKHKDEISIYEVAEDGSLVAFGGPDELSI